MVKCIYLLDDYQSNKLTLPEFLSVLFDLAVINYHSDDKNNDFPDANDCIKTAQIGTDMKKEIRNFIIKYLIIDEKLPRVRFFPVNLDLMNLFSKELQTLEKIQAELEDDIFYDLLSCVDHQDKERFIDICSDWERTCINMWKTRVEGVNKAFAEAMSIL